MCLSSEFVGSDWIDVCILMIDCKWWRKIEVFNEHGSNLSVIASVVWSILLS